MKTLILILLAILCLSCEKDEPECTCMAKYVIVGGSGSGGNFYVNGMTIDCNTGRPTRNVQPNAVFVGCE